MEDRRVEGYSLPRPPEKARMEFLYVEEMKTFENYCPPSELIPSDPRFGSGPSLVPCEFINELQETGAHLLGTSHRKKAVKDLIKSIQKNLMDYFNLPHDFLVALGNGGATFLFDAIGLGLVQEKSEHFICGEFSQKWWKAHENIPWIQAQAHSAPQGSAPQIELCGNGDLICCTLNETSTGVALPQLPCPGEQALLCVDATSGGGQVACDVSLVDVFFFSPQKVFASEGGLFVAILSPKAQKRIHQFGESSSRYLPHIMNWKTHIENAQKHQTYTTPSISTLFLLERQVQRLMERGYRGVVEEGQKRAKLIYDWAESKDYLQPYIQEKKFRSCTVATIDVDEKVDVDGLLKRLYEQRWVYGIEPYRKLGRNQFRIALFYNIRFEDLEKLTKLLSHAIEA